MIHFCKVHLNPAAVKKILWLIDDDELSNLLNKRIIERMYPNLEIVVFQNAEMALKALEELNCNNPQVIFLDINMPIMNGFEFIREIEKRKLDTSCIEIHMLSSSINPADKIKAISFNAVKSYITKPLSIQRLIDFKNIFGLGLVV